MVLSLHVRRGRQGARTSAATTGKDAVPISPPRRHRSSERIAPRPRCARRIRCAAWLAILWGLLFAAPARAEVDLPALDPRAPLRITAERANHWRMGAYDVWLLRDNVAIAQGQSTARSQEALLWVEPGRPEQNQPTRVIAYLEQGVECRFFDAGAAGNPAAQPLLNLSDKSWFGRFYTLAPLQIQVPEPGGEPQEKPPIFLRGMAQLDPNYRGPVQPAQFVEERIDPVVPTDTTPIGTRRVRVFPRSDAPVQAQWFPSPGGQQWVAVITSGVNLIVDGLPGVGTIDVSTDRLVIWTAGIQPDLSGQSLQSNEMPLEIYMEGNIVFRQGERVIFAKRMFYDVRNQTGIVLDAEMLTPVPNYAGMARLKAGVLRQLDESRFVGSQALATSSRMGDPRYSLTSNEIYFEDQQRPAVDPATGAPVFDPATGEPVLDHQRMLTSRDNFLRLGGVPVLYWPTMATNLEDPAYYISQFQIGNDNLFGTQVKIGWDMYQILGVRNPPPGSNWRLDTDYLSDRGPALGTNFEYQNLGFLGVEGPASGMIDVWGIYDTGLDNLGGNRKDLTHPDFRGRVLGTHFQELPDNYTLTAQVGLVSDYNFIEQFFEREWDARKDPDTAVQLKQIYDNQAWSILGSAQVNDFWTDTQWLPRLDHYWLGQSLLGDRLTWFEHSQVAYANMRVATPPVNQVQLDQWTVLPWEANVEGERLITRQEIDLPFNAGAFKIVPYALGELAHWGEGLDGEDVQRAYGQVGARASIPFWTVDPNVENQLLNVHGLAHKVVFETEVSYAQASIPMTELPLYDEIDDTPQIEFTRQFIFTDFGGVLPTKFDPRFYALRTGTAGSVTAPVAEIADDLTAIRTGMKHRWQTKRGHPSARQIVDWITFDTNATIFPEEDQNFGELLGLIDYDFRWYVGDRLTLLSSGIFDVYPEGYKEVSVGGFLTRPPRGNIYMGVRSLQGPIDTTVLNMAYNYQMSPKWISSFGTSFDMADGENIGQNFVLTRVGESLLVQLGFNVDAAKDVVGVSFMIEPRFLPSTRAGSALGAQIPPAGAFGLE